MPRKGYRQTEEHKINSSRAQKGRKFSKEHKRKMSLAHKGKKRSEETKRKISIANKGKNNSMFGKTGEGSPFYGKKHTNETKQKISKNHRGMLGKKHSEETKLKMSIIRQNMPEETKLKISKITSEALQGKNNPNWCGGTSLEPYCQEFTKDFKAFIKERDGYKCMTPLCNKPITKNNLLGVHHIDYDKKNCTFKNLISNCRSCNSIANFNRDEWKEIYRIVIKQNYNY